MKLNLETDIHWQSVFFTDYVSALELRFFLSHLLNKMTYISDR